MDDGSSEPFVGKIRQKAIGPSKSKRLSKALR